MKFVIATSSSFTPLVLLCIVTTHIIKAHIIETKYGEVEGKDILSALGKSVTLYSGIPYADPPIGEQRFKPPIPNKPWPGVYQATEIPLPCVQQVNEDFTDLSKHVNITTSEDCLKLNIWVKSPAPINAPVLVYIHGGAFLYGRAIISESDGATLASEEDILVVTISYRLNIFGFLGLKHINAPGNQGLMDQNLALRWIKENIEKFGGNPNSVTLMGMSAGSTSIGYHLMSRQSVGLFERAILMSGAPCYLTHQEPEVIYSKARALAKAVGCLTENVSDLIDCLQKVPSDVLLESVNAMRTSYRDNFRPTVDGAFLTAAPDVSIASRKFNNVPILIGTTSDEGGSFAVLRNKEIFTDEVGSLNREEFRRAISRLLSGPEHVVLEAVEMFYRNWSAPDDPIMFRDAVLKAYGDYMFVCPVNAFSDSFAEAGNKVYRYVYDQKVSAYTDKAWLGPSHGTDRPMFFGTPLGKKGFTVDEEKFSKKLMKLFTGFSRTGNPNTFEDTEWPAYTLSRRQYLKLSFQSVVGQQFRVQECAFWEKLIPAIQRVNNC